MLSNSLFFVSSVQLSKLSGSSPPLQFTSTFRSPLAFIIVTPTKRIHPIPSCLLMTFHFWIAEPLETITCKVLKLI